MYDFREANGSFDYKQLQLLARKIGSGLQHMEFTNMNLMNDAGRWQICENLISGII